MLIAFCEEDTEYEVERIYSTDSCSDNLAVVDLYCKKNDIPEDNYGARKEAREKSEMTKNCLLNF